MNGYNGLSTKELEMIWEPRERLEEMEAELRMKEAEEMEAAFAEEEYHKWLNDLDRLSMAIRAEEDEVAEGKGIVVVTQDDLLKVEMLPERAN